MFGVLSYARVGACNQHCHHRGHFYALPICRIAQGAHAIRSDDPIQSWRRAAALREWESLTQSQRATLEEYRTRLQVVTDRVTELERQLIEARHTIDVLERQGDEQARKIVLLEQERALWEAERTALRDRIAELEGCR